MAVYCRICVRKRAVEMFNLCKELYLKKNPCHKDEFLSEDFMMREICDRYLDGKYIEVPDKK